MRPDAVREPSVPDCTPQVNSAQIYRAQLTLAASSATAGAGSVKRPRGRLANIGLCLERAGRPHTPCEPRLSNRWSFILAFHRTVTLWSCLVHLGVTRPAYRQGLMKTMQRPHGVNYRDADVGAFFETLKSEQTRFLEAIREAGSLLRRESGQLALVAATHSRLTQQFFDAQRSILTQRAEVDAEVARIACAVARNAPTVVADAHDQTASSRTGPLRTQRRRHRTTAAVRSEVTVDDVLRSPRQEIARLGVEVVRTIADVDSLERVINEAFEPDEPDGITTQRQLAAHLDDWWRAETQAGLAAIDDAHATVTMRRHIARIEAGEVLDDVAFPTEEPAPASGAVVEVEIASNDSRSPLLPGHIADALDSADPADLQSLFAGLADSLDRPSEDDGLEAVSVDHSGHVLIRLDGHWAVDRVAVVEPEEAFRRFWTSGQVAATRRSRLWWVPGRVLVQLTAATFVLVALVAWIG